MKTIRQLLQKTPKHLLIIDPNTAHLDAELLLSHILQKPRAYLHAHPEEILSSDHIKKFNAALERRLRGEPIAYIIGHQEFWSLDFLVNAHTLVPRPETELLVECALALGDKNSALHVADLGTGCGAIAIALAHERPHWKIVAIDQSKEALDIAKRNMAALNAHLRPHNNACLPDTRFNLVQAHENNVRIIFHHGDWFKTLPPQKFHLIVSNPPYLADSDPHLKHSGICHEPRTALVSGKTGLEAIEEIIFSARNYLHHKGYLLLEHGIDQAEAVRQSLHEAGYQAITDKLDLAGHSRVAIGRFLLS